MNRNEVVRAELEAFAEEVKGVKKVVEIPKDISCVDFLIQKKSGGDVCIIAQQLGSGVALEDFTACIEKASKSFKKVLVLEHNADSKDWKEESARATYGIDNCLSERKLNAIFKKLKIKVTIKKFAGYLDKKRDILFVTK